MNISSKGIIATAVTAAMFAMLFLPVIPVVASTAPQPLPYNADCASAASALSSIALGFGQVNLSYQPPDGNVLFIANVTGFAADSASGTYSVQSFVVTGTNLSSGKQVLAASGKDITMTTAGNATNAQLTLNIPDFQFSAVPSISPLTSLSIYALTLHVSLNCDANTYQVQATGATNVATVVENIAAHL